MNKKITATIAVALMAMVVFAAVGATTYSWFSDSDETDITITTAGMEISTEWGTPVVTPANSGTTVSPIGSDGVISITNLVANRTIVADYTVSYKSTINTVYRVYAQVSASELDTNDTQNIFINGKALSTTDSNGMISLVGWRSLSAASTLTALSDIDNITITTPSTYEANVSKTFGIKVVAEIYQGDYVGTDIINGSNPVVSGVAPSAGGTSNVLVTIDFTGQDVAGKTLSMLTKPSTEDQGFVVGDSGTVLSLKLDNGSATFTDDVPVKVTLPGNLVDGLTVSYVKEGSIPEMMDLSVAPVYDSASDTTIFTFLTDHFSEFMVTTSKTSMTINSESYMVYAFQNLSGTIVLGNDITRTLSTGAVSQTGTVYDSMIRTTSDFLALDLNGYTLTGFTLSYLGSEDAVYTVGNGTVVNDDLYAFWVDSGSLTINDGTYTTGDRTAVYLAGTYDSGNYVAPFANVVINGGTFTAAPYSANNVDYGYGYTLDVLDSCMDGASLSVKGGSFYMYDPSKGISEDPVADFVADGYVSVQNGDYYDVIPAVAESNGNYYASLYDAVMGATSGSTINMLADSTSDGVSINMDLTIDLGGFTLTSTGGAGSPGTQNIGFQLLSGNDIVIRNGTIVAEASSSVCKMLIQNYSNLTLDNVVLDGTDMTGGYVAGSNGVAQGYYTLSNNSGNVTISNSTIIAHKDTEGRTGYAFDVYGFVTYSAPVITVTDSIINGNVDVSYGSGFTGTGMPMLTVDSETEMNGTVTAGAYVDGTYYASFTDAMSAVGDAGEVVLYSDATVTSTIIVPATSTLVIDLNGFDITKSDANINDTLLTVNGTLTIEGDGTVSISRINNNSVNPYDVSMSVIVVNGGALTLNEGVTVRNDGTGSSGKNPGCQAIRNMSGTLIIDGADVISEHYIAVEVYTNKSNTPTSLVVKNGAQLTGYSGLWFHLYGDSVVTAEFDDCTIVGVGTYAACVNGFDGTVRTSSSGLTITMGDDVVFTNNNSEWATVVIWNEQVAGLPVTVSGDADIVNTGTGPKAMIMIASGCGNVVFNDTAYSYDVQNVSEVGNNYATCYTIAM